MLFLNQAYWNEICIQLWGGIQNEPALSEFHIGPFESCFT